MAQADTDFDWTTAQPVEEDETSATLTATTFGQRSMPVPTQGPVNIDTEFDWKTATLDEPFDPATAQPISEQEEQQLYQDLEVASRDPQRILTNTEHSLLYDHRQQQDDAVARFFQGAEDVPGNLLSLGMDAGTELRENWFENMFRPDRFAARNLATGMEIGRKAGVQLLQLVNWGQNKVADTIQRGNANDAKMREIAATVPKTGDERVDGDNVMAAIAKARNEGVFEETPFGPDKEQDYERYLQQNSYARSHAGNITEAAMGGKTMTFPNEQTTVLGQQPMQAVSTIGAMGLDITSALPMGAGIFSKLRVLRRLSRVTGMPLPAVERGLAGVADGMEDFGSRVAARVTDKTGLSKTQQVASLAAVSGGAGLLAANTDGMDGVLLPVAAVSGIVPAYKLVGGTIRKTSQAAGTSAMVLREMRAGNIGAVRQAAADDLLRTGTVPPQYAAYMRPYANGVESTLGRVAKNPDNPEITRKLARLADGSGVTQAVRFADDAVSSGIAATLASTPFALLAPDAEQAGAIVGGAATLGTFAGPFAGAFGRSSSRKDADIARMLIDVHAVNGDVPALISLGRDRLGQIAGMQGVVAGKTDFVTLRASDYRANVDVRATGNETGAGVFIEKASNGTARIFINVGEPASMDGKVRVRDRGDGVREVRVRGNDGRTEFIAAPKGRRLLVNDGDTVKAGQQVVDYMPPSRSMPHEIAHAILTSDILDGDIRTDMRNYVTQVYGEDGIKARGREYMAQIVDGDIMFGTHEGAVALTPEEIADVRSGKRTMSDVMKGKPVEAAERDALIDARIDEYNQRSREKGGNDYDWARDEVTAEQFAGEAKGIDFRSIRAGGPKVLESALATSARVLEVLGAKFDRTTGKPLDNPSVLFRDNPLFQSPVLRKRMIEHVRAYNDLLAGLEDAGKRETRGTKVSVDGTPDSAARSPHTKMRPDPDKGGQVGNEFLYVDETGKTQWRSPSEVRAREGSRTSQANTMYNPSRILAPNSTEFGRRTTDSGRTIVSGPTLPAQFDHFVHFPKWMREFARVLEASRELGMTFIADYNAIGDGKDGVYRVRNRGDIRAIQREVAFVGWELTGNKHLKTVLMDLNAFRASAMKAINNGELGIFNNDMQVIEADLRTYLGNHRNGLPGEAGIGQAKRDMLNGLIGTGTAVQRKANPLFSDLNPRGSVRSFRLDRYNDLTPTGREGLSFDYDKINNNRMPQQIPREAQGMPDAPASGRGDGMPKAPRRYVPMEQFIKEAGDELGAVLANAYNDMDINEDRNALVGFVDTRNSMYRQRIPVKEFFDWLHSDEPMRGLVFDSENKPATAGEGASYTREGYEALLNRLRDISLRKPKPSAAPRGQAMPDSLESVPTDQLLRQYEENQGYLGLSTLGMREGRPVRGGAAQTRELLRRNEAISAELERRGVRQEDPQLQRALQRRGQAMPDAQPRAQFMADSVDEPPRSLRDMPQSALKVLHADSDVLPKPTKKLTNATVALTLADIAEKHNGGIITSSNITPEQKADLKILGADEGEAALKASGKNAGNWYSVAIEAALGIAGVIYRELSDAVAARKHAVLAKEADPVKAGQFALRLPLAITSQNMTVKLNTRASNEQFNIFLKTGKFDPSIAYGEKAKSISGNLDLANVMIDELGSVLALEDFVSREFTVRELEVEASKIAGRKITIAGRKDDIVNGAAIFGPKIGQGFLQNLMGKFDPVTIDLWMRRTWGRWTGDAVGDGVTAQRLARLIDESRKVGRKLPDSIKRLRTTMRSMGETKTGKAKKPELTVSEDVELRLEEDTAFRKDVEAFAKQANAEFQALYRLMSDVMAPALAAKVQDAIARAERLPDQADSILSDTYNAVIREQSKVKKQLDKAWDALSLDKKKEMVAQRSPEFAKLRGKDKAQFIKKSKPILKKDWLEAQHQAAGRTALLDNPQKNAIKPAWANAAKSIVSELNPIDIPSDMDRRVITEVVNGIREELERRGYNVTNADVQAILWYPEKDLWAKLRGEEESILKQSYDDEFINIAEGLGLGREAREVAKQIRGY